MEALIKMREEVFKEYCFCDDKFWIMVYEELLDFLDVLIMKEKFK